MVDKTLRSGVLSEPLRARCCGAVIQAGEYVTPLHQPSPNRVLFLTSWSGIHKVKASTYRRVVRVALRG